MSDGAVSARAVAGAKPSAAPAINAAAAQVRIRIIALPLVSAAEWEKPGKKPRMVLSFAQSNTSDASLDHE
ncbi:hypothetical protein [Mycobacterium sp. 360MFTsu5.1]|uniref:hypothetical protein n=1 Tax=Mycobacterium sp. 360MFTsu5.1 TaxID=1172186 RepID=UPI0003796AD4|nr:hypothetical protein [Mycobacterium sp. 360MFTsu5.1]